MKTVLGLSVTAAGVGWVLVEGTTPVDDDKFVVRDLDDLVSRCLAAVRGAQRDELRERFQALHEERYGHRDPDGDVELVTVRVTGRLPAPPVDFGAQAGEARLTAVLQSAGFTSVRRAAETPFNLVLEARA